jgi:hypothetical protein
MASPLAEIIKKRTRAIAKRSEKKGFSAYDGDKRVTRCERTRKDARVKNGRAKLKHVGVTVRFDDHGGACL